MRAEKTIMFAPAQKQKNPKTCAQISKTLTCGAKNPPQVDVEYLTNENVFAHPYLNKKCS